MSLPPAEYFLGNLFICLGLCFYMKTGFKAKPCQRNQFPENFIYSTEFGFAKKPAWKLKLNLAEGIYFR